MHRLLKPVLDQLLVNEEGVLQLWRLDLKDARMFLVPSISGLFVWDSGSAKVSKPILTNPTSYAFIDGWRLSRQESRVESKCKDFGRKRHTFGSTIQGIPPNRPDVRISRISEVSRWPLVSNLHWPIPGGLFARLLLRGVLRARVTFPSRPPLVFASFGREPTWAWLGLRDFGNFETVARAA
jgi:hypothetical protein